MGIGLLVDFEIAVADFAVKFSFETELVLISFQTESSAVISGREAKDIRVGTAKSFEEFKKEAVYYRIVGCLV